MSSPSLRFEKTPLSLGIQVIRLMVTRGYSLGVTQLAKELGMPKSSIHRLLQTLREIGFVEKSESTQRYTINPDIFEFVHGLATQFGRNLRLEKHLQKVATRLGCSVYLSMLGARETYVVCAAGNEGGTTRLGSHSLAYATSAGKVLVAHLPEESWAHYAPQPNDRPLTSFTNHDIQRFYEQLKEARARRVAWNRRESSSDHVSVATVVREPFIDPPRLTVALLFRQESLVLRDHKELEDAVFELAEKLEKELGSS
jgi:DNA-binding IclR family transcriptional regulator